ncbi:MAG: LytR/AlgR family response regulator transcription factor [Bacteroidales bacterium]
MKLNCIAIDDEPIALNIIENFCNRIEYLNLETYNDPVKGTLRVKETIPNIVLLDIEMPDISGLDLAKELPIECYIIFTTAHANFAIDGFELEATDYLLKPFSFERFEKAILKVKENIALNTLASKSTSDNSNIDIQESIVVKVEYKNTPIIIDSILYIEAMDSYVKIYISSGRSILSLMNLKAILKLLPKDRFLRIHKSYVVSRDKIVNYNRKQVKIINCTNSLPIGRTYYENFEACIVNPK